MPPAPPPRRPSRGVRARLVSRSNSASSAQAASAAAPLPTATASRPMSAGCGEPGMAGARRSRPTPARPGPTGPLRPARPRPPPAAAPPGAHVPSPPPASWLTATSSTSMPRRLGPWRAATGIVLAAGATLGMGSRAAITRKWKIRWDLRSRRLGGGAERGQRSRPSCRAWATAWVRLAAPSLLKMWLTCFFTVSTLTTSSAAISWLPLPAASS